MGSCGTFSMRCFGSCSSPCMLMRVASYARALVLEHLLRVHCDRPVPHARRCAVACHTDMQGLTVLYRLCGASEDRCDDADHEHDQPCFHDQASLVRETQQMSTRLEVRIVHARRTDGAKAQILRRLACDSSTE